MAEFKKIDHVVIATEDLDDALAKWERNVGLTPDASLDRPLGSGFKASSLPIGESFLELVQPVEQSGRFYERFQERGEGLFSISIEVDDLEDAVSYLRGEGANVSDPENGIWPNTRVARVNKSSTHGVSIQLIQRS
jgi:catechol 2,3-dioxygenase-like lactoylglutathione lyase family enzyme